ncbi:MAG: response regulator [Acidobacteriota bacterium]
MPRKILVADDSLTIQKVVELTFSDADYMLTCVSNGRLALEKAREDPPDLILADVVMPEKNGYEVCEAIKRNPATAGIPVVLLAGTFEPFDRDRAERLGCDAIVSKPFDSHQLFRKVEELLAGRAAATTAARARPEPARETPIFTRVPPSPFEGGFAEEDFTGSIRNLRGAGSADALESLYGPEDVETALAAFREVEPAAPAARERDTPVVRRGEAKEERMASDDGRTQRIDVSKFRAPRATDPIAAPVAAAGPVRDVGDDTDPMAPVPAVSPAVSVVEPTPPLPASLSEVATHPDPLPAGEERESQPADRARELSDAEIERLAERVAAKVVERLSERVVKEIAWEVVPEMAEMV